MPSTPLNHRGDGATFLDAGQPPADVNTNIHAYLRDNLRDPHSTQVESIVGPGYLVVDRSLNSEGFYGWVICFDVNAKNAYGGYTGFKRTLIAVRDGARVASKQDRDDYQRQRDWVDNNCNAALAASK